MTFYRGFWAYLVKGEVRSDLLQGILGVSSKLGSKSFWGGNWALLVGRRKVKRDFILRVLGVPSKMGGKK